MMGLMAAVLLQPRTHPTAEDKLLAYARRKWSGK